MNRAPLFLIAAAFGFATDVSTAEAAGDWDVTSAGCVVQPTSAAYQINVPDVTFSGTTTGVIALVCAVSNATQMDAPSAIELQYVDSTVSSGNYVGATFFRVNKNTGNTETIASVTSNSCTQNLNANSCATAFSSAGWNPSAYRYMVQVVIARTSSANTERFFGVSVY